MIQFKDGVVVKALSREMFRVLEIVEHQFLIFGLGVPVVTSANDGVHGLKLPDPKKDVHYQNRAFDFRLNNVAAEYRNTVCQAVGNALGEDYIVLHESAGTPNEHMHIQFGRQYVFGPQSAMR